MNRSYEESSCKFKKGIKTDLLFNRVVVFNLVVENLQVLENLRMKTDFFEEILSDLMIFDHPQDADLSIVRLDFILESI